MVLRRGSVTPDREVTTDMISAPISSRAGTPRSQSSQPFTNNQANTWLSTFYSQASESAFGTPNARFRTPIALHDVIVVSVRAAADPTFVASQFHAPSLVEGVIRLLEWYRAWYGDGNIDRSVSALEPYDFAPRSTSAFLFTLLYRSHEAGRRSNVSPDMASRVDCVCNAIMRQLWSWDTWTFVDVYQLSSSRQRALLLEILTYDLPEAVSCAFIRGCLGGSPDHAGRLTADNGLPLMWIALEHDNLSAAQAMVLAGCPLKSTPNLLYSDLSATAYDRMITWASEEVQTCDAFLAAMPAIPSLVGPATSYQASPTDDAILPPRMRVAVYLGVRTGTQARGVRQALQLLGPIRSHLQHRNETLRNLASQHGISFGGRVHMEMLMADPPFLDDELPKLLSGSNPHPVDPITLAPITNGSVAPP